MKKRSEIISSAIFFFTHLFRPEIWYQNYFYDAYTSKYLKAKLILKFRQNLANE